ncbi:MAG: hypothetical protein AMJ79_05925 [Phycisphaerae bacterium SM23_30]|nr:MAG: hypothetical protein AMJ79_05925 [Phycisphaerae bacterium SM23_30]
MVCAFEQRRAERSPVEWPISIWHPKASRFFNGHSVNVSSVGALVELPMKAPVREGQDLEINFPRFESLAKDKGSFSRVKNAQVVRIDRSDSLLSATVKVGLDFGNSSEVGPETV